MGCTATGVTAVDAQLLIDVKNQLNISWDDNATDNKIANLIQNGVAYLNDKLGEAGDYSSPGYPRALLFEHVRYARDEAMDVFENNYTALILAMQNQRKVAAFGASNPPAAEAATSLSQREAPLSALRATSSGGGSEEA